GCGTAGRGTRPAAGAAPPGAIGSSRARGRRPAPAPASRTAPSPASGPAWNARTAPAAARDPRSPSPRTLRSPGPRIRYSPGSLPAPPLGEDDGDSVVRADLGVHAPGQRGQHGPGEGVAG